jgi:hypothetical protein
MPQPLSEVMQELFDSSEEVSTYINTGVLPQNLAEIAAVAMQHKPGEKRPPQPDFPDEPYLAVGALIAARFFPNAPLPEEDKFMPFLCGKGPAPRSVVMLQSAAQVQAEVMSWNKEDNDATE